MELTEMKPGEYTPAHHREGFAELVCSNSLKAKRLDSAAGLLKEEMRRLGSVCVPAAFACEVPAGGALAVDRDAFSGAVTARILAHPLITVRRERVDAIPADGIVVVATGPLTAGPLAEDIARLCGGGLSFFDAAAPLYRRKAVNMDSAFRGVPVRPGRRCGEGDYINCPLNKEEYEAFHAALAAARPRPCTSSIRAGAEGV